MEKRPTFEENYTEIAGVIAKRSNCKKRKVGAIIVKDNKIISAGYNGTPHGIKNCFEGGCKRCNDPSILSGTRLDECVCLHAEENAILHAKCDIKDAELYCTHQPCLGCLKRIIQVKIKTVFYAEAYPGIEKNDVYSDIKEESGIRLIGNLTLE